MLRQEAALSHALKAEFVGDALCKSSYLFPQLWSRIPVTHSNSSKAWSKPWMLAASHWERWWGLSMLLFCVCYSAASIHTEACPLRQRCGFDSMEWEGPSLPGVWYNERKLTKHDLQLSPISSLKQLRLETVQPTALIQSYICLLVLSTTQWANV